MSPESLNVVHGVKNWKIKMLAGSLNKGHKKSGYRNLSMCPGSVSVGHKVKLLKINYVSWILKHRTRANISKIKYVGWKDTKSRFWKLCQHASIRHKVKILSMPACISVMFSGYGNIKHGICVPNYLCILHFSLFFFLTYILYKLWI